MSAYDPLDPTQQRLDSAELWNDPQVAVVARRIQQGQGFDPLDPRTVKEAVWNYRNGKGEKGIGGTRMAWQCMPALLTGVMTFTIPYPGRLVMLALFALCLIPAIIGIRKFAVRVKEVRRTNLPVIVGHIECIRALSSNPREQDRIELQWRRRHNLASMPGTHYKVPST